MVSKAAFLSGGSEDSPVSLHFLASKGCSHSSAGSPLCPFSSRYVSTFHISSFWITLQPPSFRASLVAQTVKNSPAMQETQVQSLDWEDSQRREWPPTPVFLPGESYGQRSLVGYNPWGHRVGHAWSDLARITKQWWFLFIFLNSCHLCIWKLSLLPSLPFLVLSSFF